ncbi:hypothetical protein FQN53_007948 [Emmonsiellopsis sp. PD_33]|nr:hypothetical protein FQN53_007948 [Emmonsiellopsis sp. PD_33]
MATIAFPALSKSHTVHTHLYTYAHSPPHNTIKQTILFLHGFPSSSFDWRNQITYFTNLGYGVLVPDLLGYGQPTSNNNNNNNSTTSQPASLEDYKGSTMAADIIALLDHENLTEPVHAVGHDIGCYLLSKLANYFPSRLASVAFLGVPYSPPAERVDFDKINAMMKMTIGFERFGYIKFFISDEAAGLIEEHMDSFFSLFYPADPDLWVEHLGPTGALEAWLRSDRKAPLAPFITEEVGRFFITPQSLCMAAKVTHLFTIQEKSTHRTIMRGHYRSALMWYRALAGNINVDDEIKAGLDPKLRQPVLMMSPKASKLNPPGAGEVVRRFADRLTVKELSSSGHWAQLEVPGEVNEALREFFERSSLDS